MKTVVKKERRGCRQAIHNLQLRPYVENGVWDGRTYLRRDDPQGHGSMTDGLRLQMRKMAQEGVWGPITINRKIWYDGERYRPLPWRM